MYIDQVDYALHTIFSAWFFFVCFFWNFIFASRRASRRASEIKMQKSKREKKFKLLSKRWGNVGVFVILGSATTPIFSSKLYWKIKVFSCRHAHTHTRARSSIVCQCFCFSFMCANHRRREKIISFSFSNAFRYSIILDVVESIRLFFYIIIIIEFINSKKSESLMTRSRE